MTPRLSRARLALLAFLTLIPFAAHAQWSVPVNTGQRPQDTYAPGDPLSRMPGHMMQPFTRAEWDKSSFAPPAAIEKWKDVRYGMFIHFSVSAYEKKELSWGSVISKKWPDRGEKVSPPGEKNTDPYTQWPKLMTMEKFDAKQWVAIAKDNGFKYIVFITKHHDGFHMWDTAESDFKITNTPFGRDYLKELSDACHAAGLGFGIYYAQREWHHPDYDPKNPKGERHQRYIAYNKRVVHELCTKYGKVDIFWFDAAWWGGMFTAGMWDAEALYRQIRKDQPDIVINNRASVPGDFDTPEQTAGHYQERAWETAQCLETNWSFSGAPAKPKERIIRDLIAASACRNGNVILSWGPHWDGEFDAGQIARVREIGAWMKTNGDAIYGTRAGPWLPTTWGGSTKKGKMAFVHAFRMPGEKIMLPAIPEKILSAKLLDGGAPVAFTQNTSGITLAFKFDKANPDNVVVLELDGEHTAKPVPAEAFKISLFDDVGSYGVRLRDFDAAKLAGGTIDLGSTKKVTGIRIPVGGGAVKIETSVDGADWKEVATTAGGESETTIADFLSGAILPGRETRYIRLTPQAGGKLPPKGVVSVFALRP